MTTASASRRDGAGIDTVSLPAMLIAVAVAVGWMAFGGVVHPSGRWLLILYAVATIILPLAGVAASTAVMLGRGPRPAGFVVTPGAFVVPPSRRMSDVAAIYTIGIGALGGVGIAVWSESDNWWLLRYLYGLVVMLAVVSLVVSSLMVLLIMRRRPQVELTPSGVVSRELFGERVFPWECLRPGSPRDAPSSLRFKLAVPERIEWTVDRPELVRTRGLFTAGNGVQVRTLRVHPSFLVDTIGYYVDRPERRAAIGDPAEYERLQAELC